MENILGKLLKDYPIARMTKSIDRIRVVIRNEPETYEYLKAQFEHHFSPLKPTLRDKTYTHHYVGLGSRVCLSTEYTWWLRIDLCDPTVEAQGLMKQILEPCIGLNVDNGTYVSLNQVEFTLDIYPKYRSDIEEIRKLVNHHLVLSRSRIGSLGEFEKTKYQGRNGDIRKGSYGVRLYVNKEDTTDRVRLELQMNHSGLRHRNITVESLPISTDLVDLEEYLVLREGLNESSIYQIAIAMVNRRWGNRLKRKSMRRQQAKNRYRKEIARVLLDDEGHLLEHFPEEPPQVALQINRFKEYRKRNRLSVQVDQFFPKIKED